MNSELVSYYVNNPKSMYYSSGKVRSGRCGKKFSLLSVNDIMSSKVEARKILSNKDSNNIKFSSTKKVDNDKGTITSEVNMPSNKLKIYEALDDIGLAKLHNVDLSKYKISNYWTKLRGDGSFTSSLLCAKIKIDEDINSQKELMMSEIISSISSHSLIKSHTLFKDSLIPKSNNGKYIYELLLFDVHFGKLAHKDEVGEDYDIKIAYNRYKNCIADLLSKGSKYIDNIEEFVLPIGNDLIQVDNTFGTTTAGTPVDTDSRFHKIVRIAKKLLIEVISGLSAIAPVKVIVVPGNHDFQTSFMLGEIIEAWFHNDNRINVNNSPSPRKYYQNGSIGIQYTHGNEESHGDLGLIFATERPEIWAKSKFRYCKLGHFHKKKKTNYISVDERQGFEIEIIPSLSGKDSWHNKKGYDSNKSALLHIYDKNEGLVTTCYHNISINRNDL